MEGVVRGVLVGCLALFLAACSSAAGATSAPTGPARVTDNCMIELGPFYDALTSIKSHLDVGMNIGEFTTALGDAKVKYDRIHLDRIDATCAAFGKLLESGYGYYADAVVVWHDCLFVKTGCKVETVLPDLRQKWGTAAGLFAQAKAMTP